MSNPNSTQSLGRQVKRKNLQSQINGLRGGTAKCVVHNGRIGTEQKIAAYHHGRDWGLTMYFPKETNEPRADLSENQEEISTFR
jgi:hypothetical protein